MLRTYFVQQWFNLSDPGAEEALYESPVLRRFVGVDLGAAAAPDETIICRLRHLLEKHDLYGMMLASVNLHLESKADRDRDRHNSRRDGIVAGILRFRSGPLTRLNQGSGTFALAKSRLE